MIPVLKRIGIFIWHYFGLPYPFFTCELNATFASYYRNPHSMILRKIIFIVCLFVSLCSSAQYPDLKKEWDSIDTLIVKSDLTKTALERTNALYQKAKQLNLPPQMVKALIYRFTLEDRITSNEPNRTTLMIRQEIAATKDSVQKAILYSLLAKQYLQYYNNHRWNLYTRKNTNGINKEDIATWTTDDLTSAITQNFLRSLSDPKLLQQQADTYNVVLVKGNNRQPFTLFDLLSKEALEYFKSGASTTTKPANIFSICTENALGTIDAFTRASFITADSTSPQWNALELFRKLISFHKDDENKELLISLDLERIEWVYANAVLPGKEKLYRDALEEIVTKYSNAPSSSEAYYLLARMEANKAGTYQPFGDTSGRNGYIKAEEIIQKAQSLYKTSSAGTGHMENLLTEIRRKELRTQTERVNVPNKPFRSLVSFRNTDTAFIRIIRLNSDNDTLHKDEWKDDYWNRVVSLKSFRSFKQVLPDVNDHQLHSTEIKIEALPVGEYALLSSSNSGFNPGGDKLSIQFFYVSNLSYIKNKSDFFIVNRDNGKPVADADIAIYKYEYDRRMQKNTTIKKGDKVTDKNGYFRFDEETKVGTYRYDIRKGKDRLFLKQDDMLVYENNDIDDDTEEAANKYDINNRRIFFFTDRSIYRPGQSVLFKGIAVTRDNKTKLSKLINSKDSLVVYLNDVNQKKIDSAKFLLNKYGSFNGNFRLPQNVLTGNFSLSVKRFNQSYCFFSVEEYKRPTYQVSFEKPKSAYRLQDSVIIKGTAKAYAGNNIDGAKVVYNVIRNIRFRYPWYSRIMPVNQGAREIMHGEMTTDADGKFIIRFKALADDITSPDKDLLFDFSVTAEITDNNGETRSSNTVVKVGYSSLLLNVSTPGVMQVDSLTKLTVYTTNLSDEKEPSTVKVKIYSMQQPDHAVRKRYWPRPDQFVMNRKEFTNYFPTDEFEEESNYRTWPTGKLVSEGTVDTKNTEIFNIPSGVLQPGYYKIEASSTDKYGQEVTNVQYSQLFDAAATQSPPLYQFNYSLKSVVQPGETASLISASIAPHLFIIRKTDRPRENEESYELLERDNKKAETIKYTASESDRGGVFINEAYVYDNRVYTYQYSVSVPWNNKILDVKYASYRDKIEPGSNEKWTVTIETDKTEKAAAELLTGMYDASLDQFRPHDWSLPGLWQTNQPKTFLNGYVNFIAETSRENYITENYVVVQTISYDRLVTNGYELWSLREMLYENVVIGKANQNAIKEEAPYAKNSMADGNVVIRGRATVPLVAPDMETKPDSKAIEQADIVAVRKNFSETAFFFPQLYSDSSGKYSFSFTMPDALTQWKWMSIAHTKGLAFGSSTATIITQKKLMVQSNAPRFMREGDNMEFSSKISNLTDKEITGQVSFELIDPVTNTSVDGWFQNVFPSQYFTVAAGQSFSVKFPIQIPFNYNRPLNWRVVARSGNMSDGEENVLPVLTNRVLVTETLPLLLQKDTTQHFSFDKLLKNTSESLTHQGLTVEYTTNPAWYVVQALPYLIEYPYECAEQTFNRFYANTLAAYIVSKQPLIKKVFEQWKKDTSILKSNLQKNEELKQVLLQETPWVLQAESEAVQKNNLAMLFDMARLNSQTNNFIEKLSQQQLPNGSFPWFKGGNEDRYITNYILTGIGKLKKLGALTPDVAMRIRTLLGNAMKYMDSKIAADYTDLIKSKADTNAQQVSPSQIDYLYMRSFFGDIAQTSPTAWQYFYKQGKQFWIKQNSYYKAQLGLIAFRNRDDKFALTTILPALLENTVTDIKLGMYWKTAYTGWWYQSPIEHQSMMIAFMSEIGKDVNALKTWLLLNKQTNNWRTTIATADACYALLLNGSDWLGNNKTVTIQLGNTTINSAGEKTETGTGYFKKRIDARFVNAKMGDITVSTQSTQGNKVQQPSWGSVYWQYFEDMDKVTTAGGPLSITKKLFIERNTDKGKRLDAIKENEELQVGDKVVVRMELRADRDMDYLHLKDSRAASMEPVNVLSGYKWQDGLGYYESTKDASSNFFISHINKGTYVFEYPVFISHSGVFSAGIASIQCMYAPEFNSHSEGIKVRVAN